jgi:hypothetical protein
VLIAEAKMKRVLLLVIAAWLCSRPAIAQTSQSIPPQIKTIGVVTVIPPKIHIFRWGNWDTACDWLDITGLHLDRAAFEGAARALSPKYKVVRTTVDPNAVIQTRNTEVMGMFKSFPPVGEQVRQISRPEASVDAYLLIWSSHDQNTCGLMPGAIGYGIGLTKSLSNPPNLHVFAVVSLIDAKSLQTLWSVGLRPSTLRLDNFDWKDSLAEMTLQQRQLINALFPKMVTDAVLSTSREAFAGR